jgi:hypothetical protein
MGCPILLVCIYVQPFQWKTERLVPFVRIYSRPCGALTSDQSLAARRIPPIIFHPSLVHPSYTAAPYQPPMLGCVNLFLGCTLVESSSRQHLYELMDFNQLPRRKEPFPPWNRRTRRKRCRNNTCLSTFAE